MSAFLWFVAGYVVGSTFTSAFILFWPLIRPDRNYHPTQKDRPQ